MSIENRVVSLERIDHGVLPSNDLGRAFRFWSTFMGARIGFHANLNTRGLNREVPMIVFFTVANHPGFGLALQDFRLSSIPARPLEGVVWGFEVAADDLSAAADVAERQNVRCDRFADYPGSNPIKESLFVLDPDGNTVELCIRKQPSDRRRKGRYPLRRISHVRISDRSRSSAPGTQRLWPGGSRPGTEENSSLAVPKSGQFLILRKVDQVAQRSTQCSGAAYRFTLQRRMLSRDTKDLIARKPIGAGSNLIPWHEPDPLRPMATIRSATASDWNDCKTSDALR